MQRGKGITGQSDGLVYKNLLAAYTHMRHTASNPWVRRFLQFVRDCKTAPKSDTAEILSS